MFDTRGTRALHHQKAFKPVIQKGMPNNGDGVNGDIRICQIERFVFLCVKYNNKWYNASTGKLAGDSDASEASFSTMRGGGGGGLGSEIRGGGGRNNGFGGTGVRRPGSSVTLPNTLNEYDSGWVTANNNTTVTITHSLGLTELPKNITAYVSDNSSPVIGTNTILNINALNDDDGLVIEIKDGNNLEVHIGDGKLWDAENFGNSSVPSDITNGYIRILIRR